MAERSLIEWTDATWTPIRARNRATGKVGWHCEHVTPGCESCYAESMNRRLGTGLPFKPGHRKDIEIFLDDKMLMAPLRWRKPRMIFVCSMTDLFADFVPDERIDLVFAVMALTPQHTYQVLTKRAERMRDYLTAKTGYWDVGHACGRVVDIVEAMRLDSSPVGPLPHLEPGARWWPLPNVWLGVSAEDQPRADERITHLVQTPTAVWFVSGEPLLGPIILPPEFLALGKRAQVICGGESGPHARPTHPDWARSLRDQCVAAEVPFFFKQWGEWAPAPEGDDSYAAHRLRGARDLWIMKPDFVAMELVGKKRAGRLLDGREWDQMPEAP